jgi:hypothetical protein
MYQIVNYPIFLEKYYSSVLNDWLQELISFFFKLSPLNESDGQVFLLKMTKGVDGQTTQFLVFAQMRRDPSN